MTKMWIYSWMLLTYIDHLLEVQSAILDSRCYLEGGGSAESFLASEDIAVGSVIGRLRVNGNPDPDTGDINLSLREKDTPVEITPGTKSLVLVTPLDKEGVKGPSSIYVNVICDRRHSNDPSFVIPVNVRVTDVNDNAPQWIGAPYSLTLSEVTVPGTRILQGARAIDDDQQGPFSTVEYQVLDGPFFEYVQFLNPLEGTLVLKKALDYETMKNFTIRLRAQDQGNPPKHSDTILRVIITDADDQNPKFLHNSYHGEVPLNGRPADIKVQPAPIKAVDQDEGLCAPVQYTITSSPEAKFFDINSRTGVLSLSKTLGPTDLLTPATLVVKATQIDNPDRYALTTVMIVRPGTHSDLTALSFIQKKSIIKVREDVPVGSRITALPTNKPGRSLKYFIPDFVNSQYFSVASLGELILQKQLDYELSTKHIFDVVATDGISNATAQVIVDVLDVNDWEPRFRQNHYEFTVSKEIIDKSNGRFDGFIIGQIEAADGDRNDELMLSLKGQYSQAFEVDAKGNLWLRDYQALNLSTVHLVVTATDSGMPSRSTSVPITITMEGGQMAQTSWASSILGIFGFVVTLFVIVILGFSCYIVRGKKSPKSRNRVHSHTHSTASGANLVNHEKVGTNGLHLVGGNITMGNPISRHGGSGSSISAGASTILAASLEREAQRNRERERENYTAAVRSIVSRASAAHGTQLYDDDMDRDSISNTDSPNNITNKKLNWQHHDKTEIGSSIENIASAENNLTVYF